MQKLILLVLSIAFFIACSKKRQQISKYHEVGKALGTTYSILYFSNEKLDGISKSLDSTFNVVNQSMSTYIATSDISRINKGDTTVVVDKMFQEVFQLSKSVYKESKGFFDPTVGKLVNAWGFGPKKLETKMNQQTVDSLMQYVGFDKISITAENKIKKQNPNIELDFNAIAKGYCIDRIATYFDLKGIDNYLIELGGELVGKGKNIDKNSLWKVGIDDPNQKKERTLISTLDLNNRAMATSGNYRKFRIDSITGKKVVHTINPISGFTQLSEILSVSVLAPNCAKADAYATAFMAMPLYKTKTIVLKNKELDVYIIYSSNTSNNILTFETDGFKNVMN